LKVVGRSLEYKLPISRVSEIARRSQILKLMLLKNRQSDLYILASRTHEIVGIDRDRYQDASAQDEPGFFPYCPSRGKLEVQVGAVETPDCRGEQVPITP